MDEKDKQIKLLLEENKLLSERSELLSEKSELLSEKNKLLSEENKKLKEIIVKLEARIAELERRLGLNSGNSSKPPSSDGLRRPARTSSFRHRGMRKPGGQTGHEGYTLRQVEKPDHVINCPLDKCPHCQQSLEEVASSQMIKRQVFDIPQPQLEVTEYRSECKVCPRCNRQVQAAFPTGVKAPVQYGPTIRAWAIYFQQQQFIPENRLQEIFLDLFHTPIATDTLVNFSEELADRLSSFNETLLEEVKQSPVKHLDETGFRINGKTQWLHVASTDSETYYHMNSKRKALLEGLSGTVVHDHWKAYYQLKGVRHGLCHAHHLRELRALIDYDEEPWARKMWRFLRFSCRYRDYFPDAIPQEKLARLENLYDRIIEEGLTYHKELPPYGQKKQGRGRIARRTGHNLLLRLSHYREDVLRFLKEPVPFTNNQAERDLRMMKLKQKISGGFRSERGAEIFIRIRSFISTMRKQNQDIFLSLCKALNDTLPNFAPS